jgi:hypothetical protein
VLGEDEEVMLITDDEDPAQHVRERYFTQPVKIIALLRECHQRGDLTGSYRRLGAINGVN